MPSLPPSTLILRTTLRLQDNPALEAALHSTTHRLQHIIFPIPSTAVPTPSSVIPTLTDDGTRVACPRFVAWSHPHQWGYHQYVWYLCAIQSLIRDLQHNSNKVLSSLNVHVWKGTPDALARQISRTGNAWWCDVVDDVPLWGALDEALDTYCSSSNPFHRVITHTLLDWRKEGPHWDWLVDEWSASKHKSNHNKMFKTYVGETMATRSSAPNTKCAQRPRRQPSRRQSSRQPSRQPSRTSHSLSHPPRTRRSRRHRQGRRGGGTRRSTSRSHRCVKGFRAHSAKARLTTAPDRFRLGDPLGTPLGGGGDSIHRTVDLEKERRQWTTLMRQRNIVPFELPERFGSCEEWGHYLLKKSVPEMAKSTWDKPSTAPILDVRQFATDPARNTSKLSPFLALGIISPRAAYKQWGQGPAHKQNLERPSSAIAQLLWREEFHAVSRLPGFWTTRTQTQTQTQTKTSEWFWIRENDLDWTITKGNDPALAPFLHATTKHQDLDEALVVLARDGWVHHLRRHIIADYLTRGHCQADWMLGESWFRQTLVDHDACLNRCNWLWLSACAFSTKQLQKRFHYKWADYVRRKSKGVVVGTA